MASILDRYGIKEVADVTFYQLNDDGSIGAPVLFLDTLKVSTIEQTAENTSARGGKGNPELIIWDYNKEITVTLEDALFSAKSMAVMFGSVNKKGEAAFGDDEVIYRTVQKDDVIEDSGNYYVEIQKVKYLLTNPAFYKEDGTAVTSDDYAYLTGQMMVSTQSSVVISSDTFPGTYYVTGDTYARNENSGEDEFFQFIIPKAKVLSEVTLTMEAEGDPSTFSMNLKVLRPKDKKMMKLVKYDLTEPTTGFSISPNTLSIQAGTSTAAEITYTDADVKPRISAWSGDLGATDFTTTITQGSSVSTGTISFVPKVTATAGKTCVATISEAGEEKTVTITITA